MPNLPADLPEDWTSNQKISPNGTEVGLSEQHGYNYLMKQVNDTQDAVNNISTEIGTALEGVAQETTSQSIKTDTQTIINTLGTSGGGSNDTVIEMLETLLNTPKIIKHIQRGVSTFTQTTINIQLSGFTKAEKMIAIIDGGWDDRGDVIFPRISSLTESNLAVSSDGYNVSYFVSYQVIEFA